MNYPTTSKKDLYLWMEENNLQMSQYLEKAENEYTTDLLKKLWEDGGATINFSDEELIFAAMHHDLGKCGDELGNEFYSPNESDWHVKNMGKIYEVNPDIEHMDVTDRSFFLLQQYGIKYSSREFYGIRLADGMYVKAN